MVEWSCSRQVLTARFAADDCGGLSTDAQSDELLVLDQLRRRVEG